MDKGGERKERNKGHAKGTDALLVTSMSAMKRKPPGNDMKGEDEGHHTQNIRCDSQ